MLLNLLLTSNFLSSFNDFSYPSFLLYFELISINFGLFSNIFVISFKHIICLELNFSKIVFASS